MKRVVSFIIFLFLQATVLSQPCLPDGITFTNQVRIDSFQINHPNCTEIEGDVTISGDNITNLNGLSALTSIGENLWIFGNAALTSLMGLDNVTSIGEGLNIWDNAALGSLIALENLDTIGGDLSVFTNGALTSLLGLDNVTSIGGRLYIANTALTSIASLSNVNSIGGELIIRFNHALASLTGMDNINSGSIDSLYIYFNNYLSTCEVKSVCDYLASPGGTVEIHDNAPGCNSQEEVEDACDTLSLQEIYFDIEFSLYPNPGSSATHLRYLIYDIGYLISDLYSISGRKIRRIIDEEMIPGEYDIEIDVSTLPAGIYFIKLQAGEDIAVRKLIVVD